MKYRAKPVIVEAFVIQMVGGAIRKGLLVGTACFLGNGEEVIATPQMTARMEPKVGDYWVIQSDGYVYLNPKEVFERKYEPVEMNALELGATARQVGNSGY